MYVLRVAGSGRGCDSPAESGQEDDDDSMDLYSDLIIDEHAGYPPRSSQNNVRIKSFCIGHYTLPSILR